MSMQSLQSIYSQDVWQNWKKKKRLNLYTNKTSQLIKKTNKQHPLFIFVEENQFSQYNCTSV